MTDPKTQRGRILELLIAARGDWVPLPALLECAAQYSARIHELRALGFRIENRRERSVAGITHSWFRLLAAPTTERLEKAREWISAARPKPEEPITGSLFSDPLPERHRDDG